MLRRIYGLLTGRKYVGTDSIGNMYFERQHPKYPSRVLRELVPPAGQDPADYDPSSVSGEWAHWLQGGGENDHSAHPAGWAQSGQPLDKVVIQDSEEDGPSGPLSRPGTGLFEAPKAHGNAFKPQGWAPSSRPAELVASQDAEEAPTDAQSRPGTGVFEEPRPSGDYKPQGWRPG